MENITNEQIELLREEASLAGDVDQVMICEMAIHGPVYVNDNYSCAQDAFRKCRTQAEARAECARVIANAKAQE